MTSNKQSGSGASSSFGGGGAAAPPRAAAAARPPVEGSSPEIDASCRVPLLALFGGAALWLVIGSVLAMIASIKFHAPDFLADCPCLTYGRVQPAADDALLYGFCIPAALGVMLWIIARLSRTPLCLPLVPVVAANFWHLGVLVGMVGILIGDSTGFAWLEFTRGGSVLLFTAFLLIAISAVATFGQRRERELYPVALVLARGAAMVPVDLRNGQPVPRCMARARRRAGRDRLLVRQQFNLCLA